MIRTWIRVLYVRFYNEANTMSLTIGKSVDDSQKPMISVSGNKYLSPVKDNFTVKIYNLTYKQLIDIMEKKLFRIQIFCGYLDNQPFDSFDGKKIFDGGVINIVNDKKDWKDNVATFVCASRFVAKAQEWRCNVSFQSGINLYSAIKYIGKRAGMTNMNIDDSFKYKFLSEASTAESSPASYLEKISESNNSYFMNTDYSNGSEVNIFDSSRKTNRQIIIDPNKGMIIGDAPELTSNGLTWTSLPVTNYLPGDLAKIDNALINVSSGQDSYSGATSAPNAVYFDNQGLYYIFDLSYNLNNTSGDFLVKIHCKSKSLFKSLTGRDT